MRKKTSVVWCFIRYPKRKNKCLCYMWLRLLSAHIILHTLVVSILVCLCVSNLLQMKHKKSNKKPMQIIHLQQPVIPKCATAHFSVTKQTLLKRNIIHKEKKELEVVPSQFPVKHACRQIHTHMILCLHLQFQFLFLALWFCFFFATPIWNGYRGGFNIVYLFIFLKIVTRFPLYFLFLFFFC